MKNKNIIENSRYTGTDLGNPALDILGQKIDKDIFPRKLISDFIVNDEHKVQSIDRRKSKDRQPNYKLRRGLAIGTAALAGVGLSGATGHSEWITGPPVKAVEHFGRVVQEANEPKGREIPIHVVKIENADGVKGSRVFVQQGNSNK